MMKEMLTWKDKQLYDVRKHVSFDQSLTGRAVVKSTCKPSTGWQKSSGGL